MDDIKEKKNSIREEIARRLSSIPARELAGKQAKIEERLLEFANYLEARSVLLYLPPGTGVDTKNILAQTESMQKSIILPLFDRGDSAFQLLKLQSIATDLRKGYHGQPEPDPDKCRPVLVDEIDIAFIPGIAFDEKGGRLGPGDGKYDRLIPKLPNTARKVSLAFEEQLVSQVPMESHDKYVDIIITDRRIIYKI